ncbi:MAG: chemotaxis protein CheA [Planctomycetaceae bacterium]|nr:chemotaxis protein CheA [Planctomycetaceae bacterium]
MAANTESQEMIVEFVDEAQLSLQDLPNQLELHRLQPEVTDPINAVFRAIHSMKGCAGFLGLTAIKLFAHSLENTLDELRKGKLLLTADLQRAIVDGFDVLDAMLTAAGDGASAQELSSAEQELLTRIEKLSEGTPSTADESALLDELLELADAMGREAAPGLNQWADKLRDLVLPHVEQTEASDAPAVKSRTPQSFASVALMCHGEDIAARVKPLLDLFITTEQQGYDKALSVAFLDAAQSLSAWANEQGESSLAAMLDKARADLQLLVNSPLTLDAMTVSIVWDGMWKELAQLEQTTNSNGAAKSEAKPTESANTESAANDNGHANKAKYVRVREDKLDEFLNQVSSLFITGELLKDLQSRLRATNQLTDLVEEMRQINRALSDQSTQLQQGVVALRRVSIAGLFSKFPKMARSLGSQLGKKIDVHLSGEEVEIEKSLVEDLDAPLTHMIRNVVDHGIELPEDRVARGVSEVGNLWLHAEANRNDIRITIRDDGRGIQADKVKKKAVERGIITQAQADAMPHEQAVELIFAAGLSTAEKLSEVSGRGVGMDVVRTKIQEYGGKILVQSTPNVGSTFTLVIPVRKTIVVIDGLMLQQSGQQFVLPFEHLEEIVELAPHALHSVQGVKVATVRDKTITAVPLSQILKLPPRTTSATEPWPAVVVSSKEGRLCLLVDHIVGHRQVVVSQIPDHVAHEDNVTGVAQLGGGRLALVLSVPEMVRQMQKGR